MDLLVDVLRFLLTEPATPSRARSARTTSSGCGWELDAPLPALELDSLLPAPELDALLPAPAAGAENSDDVGAETEDEEPAMIAGALALELELLEEVPAGGVVAGAVIVFSNNDL